MKKRVFIISILVVLIFIFLFSYNKKIVKIKYYGTDYTDYVKVMSSLLSFSSNEGVIGDKISIKVRGKEKTIKVDYELWDGKTLYKSENIINYPVINGFNGNISFLLNFDRKEENKDARLFVDLIGNDGGHGKYVDIENFLFGNKGIATTSSEKTNWISFGEEEIIYNLAIQEDDSNYRWSLLLKLRVE